MHSLVNYANIIWTLSMSPLVDNVSIYNDINKFHLLSHSQKLPPNNMHNKSQYKMRFIHYIGNCFFIVSSQPFQVQTTQTSFETTTYQQYAPTAPVAKQVGPSCIQADNRLPVAQGWPQGTETVGWRDLVGGWTNPIEKYVTVKLEHLPRERFFGENHAYRKNHHLEMSLKFVSIHCRGATYTQVHVAAFKQF